MKILILEDEPLAARRLQSVLPTVAPEAQVVGVLDSVKDTRAWLAENAAPDLVLSDIELADGLSFHVLQEHAGPFPVIFITAYDQYAIQAFKSRGIDYLLKPVTPEELGSAINRFKELQRPTGLPDLAGLAAALQAPKSSYKKRFLVKVGSKLRTVDTDEARGFLSVAKSVFILTAEGKEYEVDFTLDQLEGQLDPQQFFRINRKCIVAHRGLDEITTWSSSRLKVTVPGWETQELVVSRDRVSAFKAWLAGD